MRAWELLRVLTPDLCRPFSKGRNGMTLGEGAAIFILETLEAALERGHEPICELIGYGTTNDAFDPLRADVEGPTGAMSQALDDAALTPGDIDYLNAHGTATYTNDMIEAEAIEDSARSVIFCTLHWTYHEHWLYFPSGRQFLR
jgi:nodulation protein E